MSAPTPPERRERAASRNVVRVLAVSLALALVAMLVVLGYYYFNLASPPVPPPQ